MHVSPLAFFPLNVLPGQKERNVTLSTFSTFSETWETQLRIIEDPPGIQTDVDVSPQGCAGSALAQVFGALGPSLGSATKQWVTLVKALGCSGLGGLRSYHRTKMYGSHCRHLFHKSCVDPWLLDHRTCPMCKMNILKALGIPVSTAQPPAS